VEKIGIGVVGCGRWGPNHVRVFNQLPASRTVAVADRAPEPLAELRAQHPGVRTTERFADLLEDPAIQAVVVATPVSTHRDLVLAALRAGKHVLCEKPLAATKEEARELARAADAARRILMVGHVFLYNPAVVWIRERIKDGTVGRVYSLAAERTNMGPIRNDVGALHDLASHDLAIADFLLDQAPRSVSARGAAFLQRGREDLAFATFEYPGQTVANVHVSWLNPRKVRQLTVVGDKRMIVWDDMNALEPIRIYDTGVLEKPPYDSFGEFSFVLRDGDITIPKIRMTEPLRLQAADFVDAIACGRPPVSDARRAVAVVESLEAAHRSLQRSGAPEEIVRA
jgi:predicted dehydrogenase